VKLFALLIILLSWPLAASAVDWRAPERLKHDQGGIVFEPSPTMSDEEIRAGFRFACYWNKNAPEDLRMPQLVIPFVGYWDGKRARYYGREVKIAAEYLSCFERVFVGPAHVDVPEDEAAARDFLVSGKLLAAHRSATRELLLSLGDHLDWQSKKIHWFIPLDANLELLSPAAGAVRGTGVKKALQDLLKMFTIEFRLREEAGISEKKKRVMWAPRFGRKFGPWLEENRPGGKIAREELGDAIKEILKATPALTDLTLADDAGRSNAFHCEGNFCYRHEDQADPVDCEADTVPYFKFLHSLTEGSFVSRLGVGLELQYAKLRTSFTERGWSRAPGYVPMPFAEVERRRRCLSRNNIPFGAAYELRFFHRSFSAAGSETVRYQFFDVPKGNAHFDSVRALVERGIAAPCTDKGHVFCIEESISRADAAVYLHRAKFGAWSDPKPAATGAYKDMAKDLPGRGSLEALLTAGALKPCGKDKACPDAKITRAEFVRALLVLRGEKPLTQGALRFYDVKKDAELAGWILRAESLRLPLACGDFDDSFCPDEALKRGDMADLLRVGFFGQ
jgi:hypothetical protein